MFSILLVTLIVLISCVKSSDAKKAKKLAGGIWKLKFDYSKDESYRKDLESYLTMDMDNGEYQITNSGSWTRFGNSATVNCQSGNVQVKNIDAEVGQFVFYPEVTKEDFLGPSYFFPYSNNLLVSKMHFSRDGLSMNLTAGVRNKVLKSEWSKVESIPEMKQCKSIKFEKTIYATNSESETGKPICDANPGLCYENGAMDYVFAGPNGTISTSVGRDTSDNKIAYSYNIGEEGVTYVNFRAMYPSLPAGYEYPLTFDGEEIWFTNVQNWEDSRTSMKTPSGRSLAFPAFESAVAFDANTMFVTSGSSSRINCLDISTGSVKYYSSPFFFDVYPGSERSITLDPSRLYVILLTHTCTNVSCSSYDNDPDCEKMCNYSNKERPGKRLDFYSVSSLEYVKSVHIPGTFDEKTYFNLKPAYVHGGKLSVLIQEHDAGSFSYIQVTL